MTTLGAKIKRIREIQGIKQDDMADKLGISQSAYSKIERDETEVSRDRLEQIAKIFGMNVSDVVSFDEKTIFNLTNNQHASAAGYNITNQYGLADNERKLYEDKIQLLEEKIKSLQKENEQLRTNK